jgi:hypothetical protein
MLGRPLTLVIPLVHFYDASYRFIRREHWYVVSYIVIDESSLPGVG